jgi:hypothetical protein
MGEQAELRIEPTAPAGAAEPIHPALPTRPTPPEPPEPQPQRDSVPVAAETGGHLRAAYAEYIIDAETNDVVVRIRDASTDRVVRELPSPEVQALMRTLNDYAKLAARRRVAAQAAAEA